MEYADAGRATVAPSGYLVVLGSRSRGTGGVRTPGTVHEPTHHDPETREPPAATLDA
jgi:hypothetical protein